MADDQPEENPADGLTQEERLRALTGDRKRKGSGKAKGNAAGPATRPGDLVDAVRERSSMDRGKDQPL